MRTANRNDRIARLVSAAAIVLVLPACGEGREPVNAGSTPKTEASTEAAAVHSRVQHALASARTLRFEAVELLGDHGPVVQERRWSVVQTAAGDFRAIRSDGQAGLVFDTASASEWVWEPAAPMPGPGGAAGRFERAPGTNMVGRERTGLSPGHPESSPNWEIPNPVDLARSVLALRDPVVRETTYEGRSVWEVQGQYVQSSFADHVLFVVDREHGFPVREQQSRDGVPVLEWRTNGVVVDGPVSQDEFRPELPADVRLPSEDLGFRHQPLEDIRRSAGSQVLLPQKIPSGYSLSGAAVGPRRGDDLPFELVSSVAVAYRRGFDRIVVEAGRLRSPSEATAMLRQAPRTDADPAHRPPTDLAQTRRLQLSGGALDGASAIVRPGGSGGDSMLIAAIRDTGVLAAGTVSGDQLVEIVQSLR